MSVESEYLRASGEWHPRQPYGYASHDVRVMARAEHPMRDDELAVSKPGRPILILPTASLGLWEEGEIDLCGRAWN